MLPQISGSAGVSSEDAELLELMEDERKRCGIYKTHYLTLKEENIRLQNHHARSQQEYKRDLAEKQHTIEKFQLLFTELREELVKKTTEVEELKLQVPSPQKIEHMKIQIQKDIEAPMKEQLQKLEDDVERYKGDYNKLRYEYTLLKSHFQHELDQRTRMSEEQKLKYETEISELERDKEELYNQMMTVDPKRDSSRVEVLLRDKAHLCQKLKDLEAEVKELRAEKEHHATQAESVQRTQAQQMIDTQASMRSLESEKQSLKLQKERLEKELHLAAEQNIALTTKLHKAEREVTNLASKVDELKQSHKIETDNIKLEAAKSKNEAERDRDKIQNQLDAVGTENTILKATLERHKELLAEKERELVRKVQAAKEAGFQQVGALQDERLELENRIAEIEKYKAEQDEKWQSEISHLEENIRVARNAEESAKRELQNLRSNIQQQIVLIEQLQKEKCDQEELKQEMNDLKIQISSVSESENNLLRANEKLRETVDSLRQEIRNTRGHAERVQKEAEKELEENRIDWLEEKHNLQDKLSQLQEKYNHLKEKLQRASFAQKKRKAINERRCRQYEEKIELLEATKEELEAKINLLNQQNVPREEYGRLKKQLKDLQRRHNEFRSLMLDPNIPVSGMTSSALLGADFPTHSIQEEQHQRDLSLIRKRLDELESEQQKQLEELGPPVQHDGLANIVSES
ncbi:centrosomal protein of 83 kDa [Spea bombifrons]|uniref:centrosomal protein of 83 kDa n=1 Tax=Spea bombifrons TaxID=233779 RepID=UPI00234A0E7C|nr:centrosomal protein of 83 kDa [Spea bombifrons]XP_053318650.1 centrosomal protein of 83 kDa [Spea bombifrons]